MELRLGPRRRVTTRMETVRHKGEVTRILQPSSQDITGQRHKMPNLIKNMGLGFRV